MEFILTSGEQPKRLDSFLASRDPMISRNVVHRLIDQGRVTVNGVVVKASRKIRAGDSIVWETYRPEKKEMRSESIPLEILYEDSALLILNKPAGLVVHPSPGHWKGTLMNALLHHVSKPGLVHRLDRETSGVMVIAKKEEAHRDLARQFAQHSISRVYEALVSGVPPTRRGVIELEIGSDTRVKGKQKIGGTNPKRAVTEYRVVRRLGAYAHVELFPQTGRTHQLRVHLAALGNPILGDKLYGGPRLCGELAIPRVMLHAAKLGFTHPETRARHEYHANPPFDFQAVALHLQS